MKLTVGGQDFVEPLLVIKDPHSGGTEADIRAQFAFLETVQENLKNVGAMIEQIETMRKQLDGLDNANNSDAPQVKSAAGGLNQKLTDLEERLYQLRITGGQDGMRWPARLEEKISHLASELQDADFAPTSQQIAVNRQYTQEIRDLQAQLKQLLNKDVADMNNMLKERNMPVIGVSANARGEGLQ